MSRLSKLDHDTAYIRTVDADGDTVDFTPIYPLNRSLLQMARNHSGRTTKTVEVVAADDAGDPAEVVARFHDGAEVQEEEPDDDTVGPLFAGRDY